MIFRTGDVELLRDPVPLGDKECIGEAIRVGYDAFRRAYPDVSMIDDGMKLRP